MNHFYFLMSYTTTESAGKLDKFGLKVSAVCQMGIVFVAVNRSCYFVDVLTL